MRYMFPPRPTGPVLDTIMSEIRNVPSNVCVYALVANTAALIPIAPGTEIVLLNASNQAYNAQIPYFVCDAGAATAALPAANVVNGTGVEFNPIMYNVHLTQANGLSVISPSAGYLYVSQYQGPGSTVQF